VDKINILMVEDEPGKLLSYEVVLTELNENLILARSGNEALECLLRNEIAIVVTDVNMPELDGFQLADMIRQHPRFQDIAIIFISGARMTMSDRLKGYEHGAVDYMNVPIIPELLRAKVRVFAELYRNRRELEKMSAQLMAAQDEERRRIARELHDGLGQELSLAKMLADGVRSSNSDPSDGRAEELCNMIENALQQVRSLSHLLHPPLLDELGLESAIRWYLEELGRRSGIDTLLEVQPNNFPRLPAELENAVYRITQEALTNVFRHSGANRVSVTVRRANDRLFLIVRDNGKGIPDAIATFKPGSGGVGVRGMRQRIIELGGELKLLNAKPGTIVEAVIPYKSAEPTRSMSAAVLTPSS
jgi:signal transduction histidine kinase